MPRTVAARSADPDAISFGELDNHLGYFVRRVQHWIFRDVNAMLAPTGLDVIRYSVLEMIGANAGISQIAVAGALGIERARMVGLLDGLQEASLIVRQRSETDRRSHALQLTTAGRSLLKKANAIVAEHERKVVRRLGADGYRNALAALAGFQPED